ncbi:ABC1 kinase family protein [Caldisalinibacter kiritimatiensis]|uniref:Ubiquinone biosynthesis monooxygenase UbiB n=1 Tax=Caldisalinibacter kiritimatiensis TaxID=1304284 RepID=R1AVH7_9FIRM|nr:AarF/UbiB family protein [Caldisalinibacter kiritimatiensis]EOD00662.1 Ubiquinone biosynthesis monooxygenase UbiB [Caldisalinibacter kiritimatiensis]
MKVKGLGKRYKNIQRYRQIAVIFAKYGFNALSEKMDVVGYFRRFFLRESITLKKKYTRAERIRMAIEELGPTFIKFGQIMSTRYDLLPADIVNELSLLQDKVKEYDLDLAKKIFYEQLGLKIDEVFKEFEETPLAAASIGQVYSGVLKNGEEVVVKIQRPNIRKNIESDIDILFNIGKLIDEHFAYNSPFKAVDIVNEFSYTIKKELDYTYEAQNCDAFRENFKNDTNVLVPKIYWEYTTKKVLVMEKINGIKVSDTNKIRQAGYDMEKLAQIGAKAFMKQIIKHGLFHADPHPGNIMIINENKISFIDFGIVGYIDKVTLDFIVTLLESGHKRNIDSIVESLCEMDAVTSETDLVKLKRDLYYIINYYFNVPINKINFGDAFTEILSVAYRHSLRLPTQLILLIRAIVTIEGTGRKLNPKFNMSMISKDIFVELSKEKLNPKGLVKEIKNYSAQSFKEFKSIPKRTNHILQKVEKNQLKILIDIEELDKIKNQINIMTNKLSLSLLVASIVIGSSLIIQADVGPTIVGISAVGLIGFSAAGILGVILVISILMNWLKDKK